MQKFVFWLFSQNNSTLSMDLFDVWHFTYLFLIFGTALLLTFLLRNKTEEAKLRAIRIFAILTIGLYIADFFIMPLSDSYGHQISQDKLPFHVCTLMGVLIPFVQFNRKLERFKDVIVCMAIASSLMWMVYPGSALGGRPPFSYTIFQTFMFHGCLFTWGFLNLSLGQVQLSLKKLWKELVLTLIILVWAALGNTIYPLDQNWFFINYSIFPFLSDEIMPPVVVFCVFGTCFVVQMLYFAVCTIARKHREKTPQKVQQKADPQMNTLSKKEAHLASK